VGVEGEGKVKEELLEAEVAPEEQTECDEVVVESAGSTEEEEVEVVADDVLEGIISERAELLERGAEEIVWDDEVVEFLTNSL